MNPFRKYNRILLFPLGGFFLLLYGLACILQPVTGDLTRLGAYWENDYGWNSRQQKFDPPLYAFNPEGTYDKFHDVLIVGDSFSIQNFPFQWQNFFAVSTGLSSVTLPIDKVQIDQLVKEQVFRNRPPRLVILQIVERSLVSRLANIFPPESQCTSDRETPQTSWTLNPMQVDPVLYDRDRTSDPFHPNFNESAHTIKGSIKRWYDLTIKSRLGKLPQTVRLPLNRKGLFSSRVQDAILLYRNDFNKSHIKPDDLDKVRCGLLHWKNTVQQNGTTRFVAMLAPDKTTAYADYINFGKLENVNLIESLAQDPRQSWVPLNEALKKKIEAGVQDVYLPNDTHWGTVGHQTAAETLVHYLREQGFLED